MNNTTRQSKQLTQKELEILNEQNKRLISEFKAMQLETNAKKNWDLFYKRNETRFFKDRKWTTREFNELISPVNEKRILLEVGCGVGNLIFPLIEDKQNNYFYFACDLSPRAIDFVKKNKFYDPEKIIAFQCDITTNDIFNYIEENSLDIITLIFVLSSIHPQKFDLVIKNLFRLLKPNGIILFRDYGLFDMAQLRFKSGHKISENFYMRQDGTRVYYFSIKEIDELFLKNNFKIVNNCYINRRTINIKEEIDVPRIFIQGKFQKEIKS